MKYRKPSRVGLFCEGWLPVGCSPPGQSMAAQRQLDAALLLQLASNGFFALINVFAPPVCKRQCKYDPPSPIPSDLNQFWFCMPHRMHRYDWAFARSCRAFISMPCEAVPALKPTPTHFPHAFLCFPLHAFFPMCCHCGILSCSWGTWHVRTFHFAPLHECIVMFDCFGVGFQVMPATRHSSNTVSNE